MIRLLGVFYSGYCSELVAGVWLLCIHSSLRRLRNTVQSVDFAPYTPSSLHRLGSLLFNHCVNSYCIFDSPDSSLIADNRHQKPVCLASNPSTFASYLCTYCDYPGASHKPFIVDSFRNVACYPDANDCCYYATGLGLGLGLAKCLRPTQRRLTVFSS